MNIELFNGDLLLGDAQMVKKGPEKEKNAAAGNAATYFIPYNKRVPKNSITIAGSKVNMHFLTCTCKQYKENVKKYAKRDIRRICKHIYYGIVNDYSNEFDDLTKLLLETQFWYGNMFIYNVDYKGEKIYLGINENKKAVSLFLKNERWTRYIYNTGASLSSVNDGKSFHSEIDSFIFKEEIPVHV
jgi:hypothetical protein